MLMIAGVDLYLGRLVLREMLRRAPETRLVVTARHRSTAIELAGHGLEVRDHTVEAVDDPTGMAEVFDGVERLLLLPGPSAAGDGTAAALAPAVAAAADAGVRHIVYPGTRLPAGVSAPPLLAAHAAVFAAIETSPITCTLVDEAIPAEFLAGEVTRALEAGELAAPVADAAVAPVLQTDVAAAVTTVLLDPDGHQATTYHLTAPDTISWPELADLASTRSGRPITYRPASDADTEQRLRATGVPEQHLPGPLAMYRTIRAGWSSTPTPDLERLTRRATGRPLTFARAAIEAVLDRTAF